MVMNPSLSQQPWSEVRDRERPAALIGITLPLIGPAPRTTMFFPLVILVAILPGLAALNSWDLTPPGPLWGLRSLAVLDGLTLDQVPAASDIKPAGEAAAFRAVCFQPPLYAWLGALGMGLSADLDPLSSVLPSYVAGVMVVVLAYLHGRLWRGGGMGLAAALLVGFNPSLLLRMQEATPTTLALAGAIGALLCYGWHARVSSGSPALWSWAGPLFWATTGGLSLALSLLALGGFGLLVIPVVILHQFYLRAGSPSSTSPRARPRLGWVNLWRTPGVVAGMLALGMALLVVLPWYLVMLQVHGREALSFAEYRQWGTAPGPEASLLARLFQLTPITLPLGAYGAARAIRLALIDEDNSPETMGGSLWVIWLAVAALAPAFWTRGPYPAMDLFLLIPLNLLAASTVADLVNRRVPIRALVGLAPATAMSVAWWFSEDLRGALDDLLHGRADAATALGLHLALDLILASIWLTGRLEHWARWRDDRQRQVLAVFLLSILIVTVGTGVREVVFRHSETHDLLTLRTMILRRNRDRPFELLAVVGPDSGISSAATAEPRRVPEDRYTGGWLRFILRTALPHLPQQDLSSIDELLTLPEGQRLVIFTGSGQRISYAVRSQLGLEAIHPGRSGVLDAYATAHHRSPRR
jgi:4-amino-4-deoxy-L-arabinose transferase-like glycosyltransferase